MKILFVYLGSDDVRDKAYKDIAKCAPDEVEIIPFNIALPGKKYRLEWRTLNVMLKAKDPQLLALYQRLVKASNQCDILLHYNGWNIHPDLLPQLKTFNVYCFFDDPESSYLQSQYIAPYFDAVFYGNIASEMQYEALGIEKRTWLPIFVLPHLLPTEAQKAISSNNVRESNAIICCGLTRWRKNRLLAFHEAFPKAMFFGSGWNTGRVTDERLNELYLENYIGWNVHNSTGPINIRLFSLAAFGMLQICDNKVGLANIFKLGEEVVGYDSTEEAIELTHYYLKNKDEGRAIAKAGFERYWNSYSTAAIWKKIVSQLAQWRTEPNTKDFLPKQQKPPLALHLTTISKLENKCLMPIRKFLDRVDRGFEKRRGGDKWIFSEDVLLNSFFVPPESKVPVKSAPQRPWPSDLNHQALNQSTLWAVSQMLPFVTGKNLVVNVDGFLHANFCHINSLRNDIKLVADNERSDVQIKRLSIKGDHVMVSDSFKSTHYIFIVELPLEEKRLTGEFILSLESKFSSVNFYYLLDPYVPFVQRWSSSNNVPQIIACCSG